MRRGSTLLLLPIVWAGLLVAPAPAQKADRPKGAKYALLVGVRKYDPNELRDLPYSESDVDELADVLKASGYKPGNVVLMTQKVGADYPRYAPEAAKVRKQLKLLLDEDLDAEDSVLVAFAGHGVQFRGRPGNYFCPSDARLDDPQTLIALDEVYKQLEACGAGMKVLLADICRNDPQTDNSRGRATVTLESATRPQAEAPPGGVVAFFSCSEGERAYEHADLKHGVFFHFVIKALKGEAAREDHPEITVPDLETYVKRNVRDFVREKYDRKQLPELRGSTRDLVPLVTLDRPRMAPIKPLTTNSIGMKFALVSAGEFDMGSPEDDKHADDDEKPRHRVKITRPFFLSVYEVTQAEYAEVMDQNPSRFSAGGAGKDTVSGPTDRYPVEQVTWNDAVAFCNKLSEREGLRPYYQFGKGATSGGDGYRLPTEAEWEYACRARSTTQYSFGDDPASLNRYAWFADRSGRDSWDSSRFFIDSGLDATKYLEEVNRHGCRTHPVGQKQPNAFGLYDMHGNVNEWCWDWYAPGGYNTLRGDVPLGPNAGVARVVRGGCSGSVPADLRSAVRLLFKPTDRGWYIGFRPARDRP